LALVVLMFSMLALGAGNGAVFQLAPQRFRKEIGVMTGLVGMTGGVGGFYLGLSLGMAKQATGSYQLGFLGFAAWRPVRPGRPAQPEGRWRAVWPTLHADAAPVRV
jgi:NNP family nitrate/nitrite transporter-like MFS transporter